MDSTDPSGPVHDITRWARAICDAPSTRPADVGGALGLDVTAARRRGTRLVCAPPHGTSEFTLNLDAGGEQVRYAEFTPVGEVAYNDVVRRLGPGRELPRAPHDPAHTLMFDEVREPGSARACAVLVRVLADAAGGEQIESVTLYVR